VRTASGDIDEECILSVWFPADIHTSRISRSAHCKPAAGSLKEFSGGGNGVSEVNRVNLTGKRRARVTRGWDTILARQTSLTKT